MGPGLRTEQTSQWEITARLQEGCNPIGTSGEGLTAAATILQPICRKFVSRSGKPQN